MQTRKQGGADIPKAGEAASLAEIGKAVSDICGTVAEAVRILRRIDQKAALVCGSYVDGEDRRYPWYRLHPARQRQVIAVRDYLAQHRSCSVKGAAKAVFRSVQSGYPSHEALAVHCYRIGIERYVG